MDFYFLCGKISIKIHVLIRIGEWITEDVTDIIHFLHGIFYNTNEVDSYIDFSKNEQFRKELENQ